MENKAKKGVWDKMGEWNKIGEWKSTKVARVYYDMDYNKSSVHFACLVDMA